MTSEPRLGTWNNVAYTVRVSNDFGPASDLRKVRDREKKWEGKASRDREERFHSQERESERARSISRSLSCSLASERARSKRKIENRARVPSALAAPKGVARPRLMRESNNSLNEGMDLS